MKQRTYLFIAATTRHASVQLTSLLSAMQEEGCKVESVTPLETKQGYISSDYRQVTEAVIIYSSQKEFKI